MCIRDRNDSKKNILASLGFKPEGESKWSSDEITKLFEENIDAYVLNSNGERTSIDPSSIDTETDEENFPIYVDKRDGAVNGYAIPISGKGLWSTLYGYFAVDPDCITAKGITFYAHKETPGLGGEVEKPWFQNNFVGKRFIDEKKQISDDKLIFLKAISNVIKTGMNIIGASTPEKM